MAFYKFAVYGEQLKLITPVTGMSDSSNYHSARFDFHSDDWKDLDKWAHFLTYDPSGTEVSGMFHLENDCIPQEAGLNLTAGTWEVWVHGGEYVDNEFVSRIVTNTAMIQITQSLADDGEVFPSGVESVREQVVAMAASAENAKITSATATIDSTTGTPSVSVSITGEVKNRILNFSFSGLKSVGVQSIIFNADGTVVATLTDGSVSSFSGIKEAIDSLSTSKDTIEAQVQAISDIWNDLNSEIRTAASTATSKATEAVTAASNASGYATAASNSANAALTSAEIASTKATEADAAKTEAEAAKAAALAAQTAAENAADDAQGYREGMDEAVASAIAAKVAAETAEVNAEKYAAEAGDFRNKAAEYAQQAATAASGVDTKVEQITADAEAAQQAKVDAVAAADSAEVSATSAAASADKAEQVATKNGYTEFYIDDDGHLHYVRTDNVTDLDFELVDGRLVAVIG